MARDRDRRKSRWCFAARGIRPGCFRSEMKTDTMQWLTWAFLIAVAAETLTRLWLGSRQIAAVQAHRDEVPEPFRGQVALTDQQRAADYTTARVRLGRWATVVEALVKLVLTLGGGLAAVDALWRHAGLTEP